MKNKLVVRQYRDGRWVDIDIIDYRNDPDFAVVPRTEREMISEPLWEIYRALRAVYWALWIGLGIMIIFMLT